MDNLTEKERQALRELVEGLKELYGDDFSPQPPLLARCFTMFFLPVGIKNKTAKYQSNKNTNYEKNCKLVHIYSPLSIMYPNVKNVINKIIPVTNADKVIPSGDAILPIINAIKIACDKLKNTLAIFSLRLFVGLINDILLLTCCLAMFFFPNRIHPESAENQTNNEYYKEKNCELVHFYPSLLNKMPNIKSVTKMIMPSKNAIFVILSGVAILPITNAIKSAWHKLGKIFANSFRWFLSGFIKNIIQQINMFINVSDLKLKDSIKL
jgi:hypothetical protein